MVDVRMISDDEVGSIVRLEEGHYQDVKRVEISPSKMSESISAFSNASGGEMFIGIGEGDDKAASSRFWAGFISQEAANAHLQIVENILVSGGGYNAEFLFSPKNPGYILHLIIFKVKSIISSTNGTIYRRKGAQNLPVKGEDALRRLRLDKGVDTFEDETMRVDTSRLINSTSANHFVDNVVPRLTVLEWLKKQNLMYQDQPTVAGILLYDDEPQAVLPKRSAIKLYRYKTKDDEGDRDTLDSDPLTIEGCLYDQIFAAVAKTKELVEGVKRLGERGLENVNYPDETLHEIITNAVLHRDYSFVSDIHIRIFDNRIEVESPGKLAGHVTRENIRTEQAARNPKVVRLINKFPNPPNKDVGEGINTAFDAMKRLKLKEPVIDERENSVVVYIRHEALASPQEAVLSYLATHDRITNAIGRDLTGIRSENSMKDVFLALKKRKLLEQVPGTKGSAYAWRTPTGAGPTGAEPTGAEPLNYVLLWQRLFIGEPLANDTPKRAHRPRRVIDAELHPIVVAEVKFRHVALQVLRLAVIVGALHAALEHAVEALDCVRVHVAHHLFALAG